MSTIVSMLAAILGIGAVILIHELGHFLAARRLGVRVETFSIGFGPKIAGFVRRGIEYRIALFPIGGYVKMAGELVGEPRTGAADEFPSKGLPARLTIVSAGVVMNFALAFVLFPLAFALGISFPAPILGDVQPGGPAWRARLRPGDEIVAVDGERVYEFADLYVGIALAGEEAVLLRVRRGEEILEIPVFPRYDEDAAVARIDVNQALDPVLHVAPGGPAAQADLRDGDRLLAINGRPLSPSTLLRAQQWGRPLSLSVERDGDVREVSIPPRPGELSPQPMIGIQLLENRVVGLRAIDPSRPGPLTMLEEGDEIARVGDRPVHTPEDFEEGILGAPQGSDVAIVFLRDGEIHRRRFPLPSDAERRRFLDGVALGGNPDTVAVGVRPGGPAEQAGLRDGDRIFQVNGLTVSCWDDIQKAIRAAKDNPIELVVSHGSDPGDTESLTVTPRPLAWPDYGFQLSARRILRTYPLLEAASAGMRCSWNLIRRQYVFLQRLLTRRLSPEHLGGVLTIGVTTYSSARQGVERLLFWLGMISISLGVINLIPLPLLDGGTLVLLLLEKIKGSPLSERALQVFQLSGLVLLASLILYVTFLDVQRIFFPS